MNFPTNAEARDIFNNLFVFFGTLDLKGFIISLEGRIFKNSDINPQLSSGQRFSEMPFLENSERTAERLEKAVFEASVNRSEVNLNFRIRAGENISVQLLFQPVFNAEDNPKYIFFCAQKFTDYDKKVISEQISAGDYKLDRSAAREIEKAERDRDFFLAFLSHELRSPLNTILGWSKILLTKEITEATRKSALETIEKSARAQAKLIDDLVDSAKISSGRLRLDLIQINLFEVLKSVYDLQKPLTEAKNVRLEFTSDRENIPVVGDSARLQQMVTILVSNALKLTRSGGYIKIIAETTENEAAIIVEDNGQGISNVSLPVVFELFQQSDGNKSFNTGALGLSIVKILTEKHNGRVRAESRGIGYGSTFTVALPLSDSDLKTKHEV